MKRNNKLMKASGVLLVLTLITSCFVGGTLAKYVSEGEGKDSARVAKWGVTVDVTGDAFKKQYSNDDTYSSVGIVVKSEDEVIAPGTYGTFGGVSVTGTPEVAVKVTTVADFELGDNWTDESNGYYCPLVIDINGVQFCGLKYNSATAFENVIEQTINEYISGTYAAGTNLEEESNLNSHIKWRWAFDQSHLQAPSSDSFDIQGDLLDDQDDEKDTNLGNKASTGNAPNISLEITTTVTQID